MQFQAISNKTCTPTSWRRLLCALLFVCVWRGPIPVLHSHSLAIVDLAANESLAEHVVKFHSDHLGGTETGLHFHFYMLSPCDGSLLCQHGGIHHVDHSSSPDAAENLEIWFDGTNKDSLGQIILTLCALLDSRVAIDQTSAIDQVTTTRQSQTDGTFTNSMLAQSSKFSRLGVALI